MKKRKANQSSLPALPANDQAALLAALEAKSGAYVEDAGAASAAFVAASLVDALPGPLVVVVDGPRTLDDFARDFSSLRPDIDAAFYPPWETLPGQGGAPLADLLGDRLDVLRQCTEASPPRVVLTCVQALMQKTLSPEQLRQGRRRLVRGASVEFETLLEGLQNEGYDVESEVAAKGQVAQRGGIIDCWPPSETWPIRLEFFGDTLESIRTFDPEDQRSIQRLEEIVILPAQEQQSESGLRDATLLDYLPESTQWSWLDTDEIRTHAVKYEEIMEESHDQQLTLRYRTLRAALQKRFSRGPLYLGGSRPRNTTAVPIDVRPLAGLPDLEQAGLDQGALEETRRDLVRDLVGRVEAGETVRIYFGTEGTLDRFVEWCGQEIDAASIFELVAAPLSAGFHYVSAQLVIVSEQDLYGRRRELRGRYDPHRRRGPRRIGGPRISDWRDIQPGELVVHIEHGIGRYLGLFEIETSGQRQEVLSIEYADSAKIYLPVAQAHLLSRYVGFGRQRPNLHALGGKRWMREKVAAEKAVRDLAANLLETQAARQTLAGHAFREDSPWQHEFEATFPYEETEDQVRAIEDVKKDMESPRPMDRLICGDVGYGKTEVAMRAAFKTVMDGRQVAVLVPTTVLAQQHYETFRQRMAAFPIRIEMLSRFRTRGEQRHTVTDLNEGRVDIVIGTHRLVQPDVQFKNLGLVIIDEEQRFGVENKEHLKALRQLVDVLTMTATPIPRTLYMSLAGARDISTIQTPPQQRLPVETIVTEYRDSVIRDGIRRELSREGQVFFLHNRVQTIEKAREKLLKLVPEARIAVGHGQMKEHELEKIMSGFVRGDFDILLCTTIIESGVDIPNVNTIFIERADRFGLSDLYQLRGRVGRYKHKAYAYLLLPPHGQIFSAARDRVRAIRKYSGLGSGFKLALRDLEIRGAGNILGAEQSGHIAAVGFDLYCQFLKRTVARMKGEAPPPVIDVEVRLDFIDSAPSQAAADAAAVIPISYMEDEHLRVNVYRKLAAISTESEVTALREELQDRLGPIPPALERLFLIALCKVQAHQKDITEIEVRDGKVMMKRDRNWIMENKRFPRLTRETPHQRLQQLLDILKNA